MSNEPLETKKHMVATYKEQAVCPECGFETLEHTGIVLLSSPQQYPHKCTYCDFETITHES